MTRLPHPRVPEPGIVHALVRPGEIVRAGQPVAELTDIWGRPLNEDGLIRTEHVDGRNVVRATPSGLDLLSRQRN